MIPNNDTYHSIIIPKHVYDKEPKRYYIIAAIVGDMFLVLDSTMECNRNQILRLESTSHNLSFANV